MLRYFLLVVLLSVTAQSFAGKITGTIIDSKDSLGLQGVVVSIKSINKSAQTDITGHFEILDVPDGSYDVNVNYVSYKKQTAKVTVGGNEFTLLNFTLQSDAKQMTGTTVKAARVTRTESAVVLEIRKASVAVSGISAAQISKTQDRNAADVVKRIPGVTIQDDRFITIRGLAERYNTVWLNDAGAPSSEVDKKAFSFDLIPSGLIDRILVFKTPSADLPGDFAGGMVKIYTTSMPAKTEYNLQVQGSYRSGSTVTDFNYLPSRSGDVFGYDNGSRNLPDNTPDRISKVDPNIQAVTQSFKNDWAYNSKKQSPDLRISGSASNLFKAGSVKFGNTFGFSYTNSRTNYNVQQYSFDSTFENYHYNDKESISKVNLALLDNLVANIGNSKIEFKNLYNQISVNAVTERTSVNDSAIASFTNVKAYQLAYENRKTFTSQLSGTHHNDDNSRKYNWTLGYSSLVRNQPGLRRLQYNQFGEAQLSANVDVTYGGGRLYTNLDEKVYSFSHQFTQKVKIGSNYSFDLNLGNYIEYKSRNYKLRQIGYTLAKDSTNKWLLSLPVNEIFADANVGDQRNFRMEEDTHDYDHYSAKNTLVAGFISANVPIGNRIKALVGVRYENNRQQLDVVHNLDTLAPDLKTTYFLPSLNITYNFTPKMLLRLAYGKTLNRPEFREQAPAFFYDFSLRAGIFGSLASTSSVHPKGYTLDVAEVQNFDARWEFYPSAGELIHVGAFYKSFKNPIQQITLNGYADPYFSFMNCTKAYVAGVEVDVRKNLMFLDDKFGTGFFKNLVLVGNVSLGKSELSIDSTYASEHNANVVLKGPLQGQSNYVVNAGFFYQNDSLGLLGSILYNVYSPRVYAIGTAGDGSIGELAFHSLDASISKVIAKRYTFTFGVQNLLNSSIQLYEDTNQDNKFDTKNDMPYKTYKPGQYFTLGVKVRF